VPQELQIQVAVVEASAETTAKLVVMVVLE
jgi:hypothetical protein